MSDDIIIDDGEPVDTGDASTSDPVDQEPVVDPGDDGNRPIIDWDEDPIEGDANAQQTFTSQPVPPYRPGDLWQDGTAWSICVNGKASGQSFAATDWEPFEAVEPTPTTSTRTVTYVEAITDYSAAKLAEYEARGAVAYAVYDDGTRQQVAWSAVSEPQTTAPPVIADEALIIAQATNQHFWHRSTDPDSDGAGTGAFVTDEEQDDFLSAIASGTAPTTARPLHNLLMNAEGILIRAATRIRAAFTPSGVAFYDGQGNSSGNVNAAFGSDGFQVGRSGESHLTGDYHSLRLVDKDGDAYFYVSDLRDRTGTVSVEDVFTADGTTRMFLLSVRANSTDYTVTVSDGSGGTVTKSDLAVSFSTAPSVGASIVVEYVTEDPGATAFTYGSRDSNETVGMGSAVLGFGAYASDFAAHAEGYYTGAGGRCSHAEGIGSTASGASSHAEGGYTEATAQDSHAEGYQTHASGDAAHAEGLVTRASGTDSHAEGIGSQAKSTASHAQNYYTIAASSNQTAIGKYNVEDSNGLYAFVIGNGTASNRSNALTVDWSGNVELAGNVKPGNVTAGRAAITGANGELATSSVTSTELYRLSGITSNVQNQLDNAKTTASVRHVTATLTVNIAANGSASGTLQATIPTGYTPVSVMCSALSNAYLMDIRVLSVDTSGLITYYIRNTSTSSAITGGTATFVVACVKTS